MKSETPYAGQILTATLPLDLSGNQTGPARTTLHPAQPADRVTDNRDQFRKRWLAATNSTENIEQLWRGEWSMSTPTSRLDEVLDGKWHGNAIEYLARDLERELNIALTERDAAREDADRLAKLISCALPGLKYVFARARLNESATRSWDKFSIESREALAAHSALSTNKPTTKDQ